MDGYRTPYADFDNDGIPDHVLGPDGLYRAFDPQTGQMMAAQQPAAPATPTTGTGALPSAAPTGGNISTGLRPASVGGGAPRPAPLPVNMPRSSGTPSVPTYQGGSRHPFFGGSPRVPGGMVAAQGSQPRSGYLQAQPGSGIGGGPRASGLTYYDTSPSSGGGGGGQTRSIISAWRDRLMGNMYPGSSSSSYPSYNSQPYKPYEPETPKMRGWSRRIDPEQAAGLRYNPSMLIPRVSKVGAESPFGDMVRDLPMAELTMMSAGKKIPAPKVDDYGNLTRKDRSLSAFTNQLASEYDDVLNEDKWFDYDEMASNLMSAGKKSALGAPFRKQPVGSQVNSFLANTGALFGATLPDSVASSFQDYAATLADRFAARNLTKPPKRTPALNKRVGRKLFSQ
jgi:hypothetical protein